jgi:hypothetical protein
MDIDWMVTLWSALVVLIATTVHGIAGFGTGYCGDPRHPGQPAGRVSLCQNGYGKSATDGGYYPEGESIGF